MNDTDVQATNTDCKPKLHKNDKLVLQIWLVNNNVVPGSTKMLIQEHAALDKIWFCVIYSNKLFIQFPNHFKIKHNNNLKHLQIKANFLTNAKPKSISIKRLTKWHNRGAASTLGTITQTALPQKANTIVILVLLNEFKRTYTFR